MEDGGSGSNSILWFVLMLILEMIFYGFSAAMQNRRGTDREDGGAGGEEPEEQTVKQKKKQERLAYMMEQHAAYATATQLGVVTINLLLGAFILYRLNNYFSFLVSDQVRVRFGALVGWQIHALALAVPFVVTVFLLYIIMTIGVMVPKKAAAKHPDKWLHALVNPFYYYVRIVSPFSSLIFVTSKTVLHLFGVRDADDREDVTEEEIISMVNEGHELGVLEAGEVEMITNIFEFGDKEASDIMTHRNNIMAIDSSMPFKDALNFMLKESNSRYPVFEETLDHIIGVLYLKDAMRIHTSDESLNQPVGTVDGLLREAVYVPETKNIDDLFRSMQSEKNQMVIVMDEYGQTSGLVTMEDILEEIVGNIMDEYDPEENHIEEKGENEYVIEGMTRLEDLNERFGISFGETEFETLNGYLISKLDRIPDEDENSEVEVDGYTFQIVKVEKNVIQSVLVKKVEQGQPESEQDIEPSENI